MNQEQLQADPNDMGFGTHVTAKNQRLIDRNGRSNVLKKGLPLFRPYDLYLRLITMKWGQFLIIIFGAFLLINLFFTGIYLTLGDDAIDGASNDSFWEQFQDDFFFSSSNLSTLGNSPKLPVGLAANAVASVESLIGLLYFALATGLFYGRFSRPQARILYSKTALISPYRDISGFMIRIANLRRSELLDLTLNISLSLNETIDGKPFRRFFPLKLERTQVLILSMTWTIVHPIDESSPLWKKTLKELKESDMEVIVVIEAFDDEFASTVYSRFSYKANEVVFGARFVTITEPNEIGRPTVDLSKLSDYEEITLPSSRANDR